MSYIVTRTDGEIVSEIWRSDDSASANEAARLVAREVCRKTVGGDCDTTETAPITEGGLYTFRIYRQVGPSATSVRRLATTISVTRDGPQ